MASFAYTLDAVGNRLQAVETAGRARDDRDDLDGRTSRGVTLNYRYDASIACWRSRAPTPSPSACVPGATNLVPSHLPRPEHRSGVAPAEELPRGNGPLRAR